MGETGHGQWEVCKMNKNNVFGKSGKSKKSVLSKASVIAIFFILILTTIIMPVVALKSEIQDNQCDEEHMQIFNLKDEFEDQNQRNIRKEGLIPISAFDINDPLNEVNKDIIDDSFETYDSSNDKNILYNSEFYELKKEILSYIASRNNDDIRYDSEKQEMKILLKKAMAKVK